MSLAKYISESFEGHMINEAFNSNILRNLQKKLSAVSYKDIFQTPVNNGWLPFKWDQVTDEDFLELDPAAARKYKSSRNPVIWVTSNDVPLGISMYDSVYSDYYGQGRHSRSNVKVYKTVLGISRDAAKAYVLLHDEKYGIKDIRENRWRSKQDAIAFHDNFTIANSNRERYKKILTDRRADIIVEGEDKKLDELSVSVSEIVSKGIKLLNSLKKTGDWYNLTKFNEKNSLLLTEFSKLILIYNNLTKGNRYEFYLKDYKKGMQNVNSLLKECEKIMNELEKSEEKAE